MARRVFESTDDTGHEVHQRMRVGANTLTDPPFCVGSWIIDLVQSTPSLPKLHD
jgi:hypothetical protein